MCTTDRHDGSCPACETDTWIAPSGLTSPETARPATETRREPEPVHAPALTYRGFSAALRALGRDGGETRCCVGEHNGFGVECDDECECRECVEQRMEA